MDNPLFAAFDRERTLREEAYLGVDHSICGIPCRQITPRLLAVLFRIRTPYLVGGEVLPEHTLQFLWACNPTNPMRAEKKRWFVSTMKQKFIKTARRIDFEEAEDEIDQFLENTFLDAPDGKPSRPYVCSIAWIEYSMASKPFGWHRDYTLNQPLRVIYQLLRCRAIDNGSKVGNRISDRVLQDAVEEINTPEQMAARAAKVEETRRRVAERYAREQDHPKGDN